MLARRRPPAAKKLSPNASPEERARAAIAKEEAVGGDKVRMTFRLVLARQDAEALSARAIREERNVEGVVEDVLAAAIRSRK
jgi:hypothetical protein